MAFHSKTFTILRRNPKSSPTALMEIEAVERRLGVRLPTSVREWYSCEDALSILALHSNDDPPIPLSKFELEQWDSNRLLPFKWENQGVCWWAILLDESDDPPVYVDVDGIGWNQIASTFSDYIYSCVWDYTAIFGRPALVQAQNVPISNETITLLAIKFPEQLRTYGWPSCTQYRFAGNGQAILVWSAENQADWWVAADDADALRSTLRSIWNIDNVGASLYECSEIGKAILEEHREKG